MKEMARTPGQEFTLLASCAYWLSMLPRLVGAPFAPCYSREAGEALAFMIIFLVLSQLWQSFKQLVTLVAAVVQALYCISLLSPLSVPNWGIYRVLCTHVLLKGVFRFELLLTFVAVVSFRAVHSLNMTV